MLLRAFKRAVHTQMPVKLIELKQCYKEEWANIPPQHLNNLKFCKDQMIFFPPTVSCYIKKLELIEGALSFCYDCTGTWSLQFDWDFFFFDLFLQPMHDDYDLRQEQLNKASLLSSKKFLENLLEKFITNVVHVFLLSASCFSLLFSEAQAYKDIHNFLYLKNHIIYTMFLMLFLFFSYFPGPWNRSFGHQLFVGLFNLCTLRPLQWNHWGAAVWHAAWDGRL